MFSSHPIPQTSDAGMRSSSSRAGSSKRKRYLIAVCATFVVLALISSVIWWFTKGGNESFTPSASSSSPAPNTTSPGADNGPEPLEGDVFLNAFESTPFYPLALTVRKHTRLSIIAVVVLLAIVSIAITLGVVLSKSEAPVEANPSDVDGDKDETEVGKGPEIPPTSVFERYKGIIIGVPVGLALIGVVAFVIYRVSSSGSDQASCYPFRPPTLDEEMYDVITKFSHEMYSKDKRVWKHFNDVDGVENVKDIVKITFFDDPGLFLPLVSDEAWTLADHYLAFVACFKNLPVGIQNLGKLFFHASLKTNPTSKVPIEATIDASHSVVAFPIEGAGRVLLHYILYYHDNFETPSIKKLGGSKFFDKLHNAYYEVEDQYNQHLLNKLAGKTNEVEEV